MGGRGSVLDARARNAKTFWFLALLAAATAISAILLRRRYCFRLKSGHCLQCGYDLRESKNNCPECGTAIPATSPIAA